MVHFKIAVAGFLSAIVLVSPGGVQAQLRLTLPESIQIALRKSKVLTIAQERFKEAEAKRKEVRAGFLPQISNSSTYTRLDIVPYMSLSKFPFSMPGIPSRIPMGDRDIYSVATSVQQPLFTGFKLLTNYKIVQYFAEAERSSLQKTEAEVIFNVENAYWGVVKAQQFQAVSEQAVRQMEAHVKDLENMYQVGMVAQNDLLRAKVQLSNTKLMRIKATNAVQMAKTAFCNTLGIALNTDIGLDAQLEHKQMLEIPLERAIQTALRERPELKGMHYNVKAAQKAVSLFSRSRWLPDLMLIGNYNYKKPNRENEKKWYDSWDVTLALQMNIWDWGSTYYQTSQAKHRLRQVEEGFKQLKDGIVLEATQSYLALQEAAQKVTVTQENIVQAQENYRVTEERFKQGMATNTEMLDANTLLTQAKMDHIQALADYNIAQAKLEKAMGILDPELED
ncbi:MAG: TolC family protein [Candidatus Latescibacteria bacterium]|nr:TolC family protein [Candidatus Latescibacterota bacterium]